jgi:hypothetical protein
MNSALDIPGYREMIEALAQTPAIQELAAKLDTIHPKTKDTTDETV